ncbi:unnamed protein product, partial [Diamesa hyperborea]
YIFAKLQRMRHIILNNNAIKTIHDNSFSNLENLISLHLQHNQLSQCKMYYWFKSMYEIVEIDLSYNDLTEFILTELLDGTFHNTKYLTYLNLSHNRLESISSSIFQSLGRLTHLILNNNAIKTIHDHSFSNLENLKSLHLQQNQLSQCKMYFLFKTLYEIVEIDLSNNNLTEFIISNPPFFNLRRLNLSHNNISNLIYIQQLHAIPDDITILDLRNNSLQTIPYNVMIRFESIDQLYLSLNPWICDCNSVELVRFFHYYRSKIVDADAMMCSDHRPFKLLESKDLCVQLSHVYFLLLMGTLLLALCSTILVIFKKEIKIWLYAHNCCLGCISEEEADKDMIYDAFFVFSHHDNNFVTDMIIDLEEKGFKCCVHHRDWAAGEMIVTL